MQVWRLLRPDAINLQMLVRLSCRRGGDQMEIWRCQEPLEAHRSCFTAVTEGSLLAIPDVDQTTTIHSNFRIPRCGLAVARKYGGGQARA